MHRFQTHKDKEATRAKHYLSRYSYVSTNGHEYLAGIDCLTRYADIFSRDRSRCVDCGSREYLELSHRGHRKMERCWCLKECGPKVRCHDCHIKFDGNRTVRKAKVQETTQSLEGTAPGLNAEAAKP